MLRKFALILAAGSAMFFSAAYALGLGEIDVNSHLNQKFSAVIPLNSISAEEAENLLVRLADSDDFNKAGIERADYLSSLSFQTVTDAKGSRIVISSKQLAREPFLSFLLDVRSSTGRVLREYTVLLDPPAYAAQPAPAAVAAPVAKAPSDFYQTAEEANQTKPAAAPAAPAPVAVAPKPAPKAAPVVPAPAPAATVPAVDAVPEASPSVAYGPVKAQETFWSIAAKLRPNPSVTMDQMLWALYNNNPQAFEGNRISGLLKGSTLKVPALSTITAVSPEAAKGHLQELQGHRATASKRVTPVASVEEEAPAAPAPASAPKAAPVVAPKPKPVSKAAAPAPAAAEKKTPEAVAPPPPVAAPVKPAAPAPAPAPVAKAPTPAPTPAVVTPPPAPPAATEPAAAPAADATTPDQSSSTTPATVPTEPPAEAPAAAPVRPAKKSSEPASSAFADDWMAPALAGAIVLILALLGVRFWQKKQAEKDTSAAPVLTSKASSNLQFWKRAAESAPAAAPSKFAVPPPPVPSVRKAESVAKPVVPPPPPPKQSNPLWDDTSTQQVAVAPAAAFDLTQTLDRHSESESKFAEPEVDEFNTTNQFDSQTLKVDAEANDPVSEADFHLAYGLYDEAALLLESAAEKNPGRTDIRVKLAETYFRANKPHEFDDVAQSLKPHLDAVEWQKIAIMGSQLLPDSPLYKGAAGATMDDSVDLAFDEPIDLGAAETKIFSTTSSSMPSARSSSSVLDFKLEDLEAPQVAKPAPAPAAPVADSNTLEFNLTDFDLSSPAKKASAAPVAETPAPAAAPAKASNAVEFDLGGFDLEPAKQAGEAESLGEDINLDDFDLGELADDSHAISAGDEAGTKLDLARAYVDMGDNDMARSLLTEVLVQGSEEQKTEAQTLIQRLA